MQEKSNLPRILKERKIVQKLLQNIICTCPLLLTFVILVNRNDHSLQTDSSLTDFSKKELS